MRESLRNYVFSLGVENNFNFIFNMATRAKAIRSHFDNTIPQDPFFYLFGPKYLASLIIGGLIIDKGGSIIRPLVDRARQSWERPFIVAKFKG